MQTRRELLGGIAGVSALLAGCQGAPGASTETRTETDGRSTPRTDETATPDRTTEATSEGGTDATGPTLTPGVSGVGTDLQRWIPAQSIPKFVSGVTGPKTGAYYFTAIDVPAILEYESTIRATPSGIFDPATSSGRAGVDLTESLYIKAGPTDATYFYVFDGGIERSARVSALTAVERLSKTGTVEGYTVVSAENAGAYAVGESTQVAAAQVTNGADVVRSAVRTGTPKYAEANETFATLLAALGGGEAVGGILRPEADVAGLRAYGRTLSYGSETTTRRYASVFDPERASVSAVESFTESQFEGSVQVRTGETLVVGERTVPTAEAGYPTHSEL